MSTPTQAPPESRHRWLVLATVALAQLMVVLDATIVNIALPSAQAELGFSDNDRQWVVTAYALAFGSLLLLGGRLSDMFGRRRMFLIGLVGFAVASALGGAAQTFELLVGARALQGVFAAVLAPAALSVLTTTFTIPKERARAFGVFGAIAGMGGAIGLLLGGYLTENFDWRWNLYVNVVIAVIAFAAGTVLLSRSDAKHDTRIDVPGVLLASTGLFLLVFGFSQAEPQGWDAPVVWGSLAASVVLLVGFVLRQRTAEHPLLPLSIVQDRDRGAGLPGDPRRRVRHVRRLPVPHLLPAADARVRADADRHGVPADGALHRHHRADPDELPGPAVRPEGRRAAGHGHRRRRDAVVHHAATSTAATAPC